MLVLALVGCDDGGDQPVARDGSVTGSAAASPAEGTGPPADPSAALAAAQDRIRAADTGRYHMSLTVGQVGVTEAGTYRLSTTSRAGRRTAVRDGEQFALDVLAIGAEWWFRADDMPLGCWLQAGVDLGTTAEPAALPPGIPPGVAVVTEATATGVDGSSVVAETDLAALAGSIAEEPPDIELPRNSRGVVTIDLADGRVIGWHASVADIVTALDALDVDSPALPDLDDLSGDTDTVSFELTELGREVDISRPPEEEIALVAMDSTDPHLHECLGA
jgi:hypothetical protein